MFATEADYTVCRAIHRKYGTTYYFASRRFPRPVQRATDAVYGFVRVPDEWVDNPGAMLPDERLRLMDEFREELRAGLRGVRPSHPVMRAFVDTCCQVQMDPREPELFLDAMRADVTVARYATYEELRGYMRGSAVAVGLMMCSVLGAARTPEVVAGATALGEAMQMTNFLRDVGEDWQRGRVYLPAEDLHAFGVGEDALLAREVTPGFAALMEFEIDRTRALFAQADPAIELLPESMRFAVKLARVLYSRILDRIEDRGYDVFSGRARTSRMEKLRVAVELAGNFRSSGR